MSKRKHAFGDDGKCLSETATLLLAYECALKRAVEVNSRVVAGAAIPAGRLVGFWEEASKAREALVRALP